jgi:hypothetical protein
MKSVNDFIIDIYFDEIESRERVVSRIQINLGIFASIAAILSYMARRLDYSSNIALIILFWIGEFSSIVLVSIPVYLTLYALTGYQYKFFPKAKEVIKYKRDIDLYKKNGVDVEESVDDFVIYASALITTIRLMSLEEETLVNQYFSCTYRLFPYYFLVRYLLYLIWMYLRLVRICLLRTRLSLIN